MVKNVFSGVIRNHPAALAILGWVAFVSGVVLPVPSVVKLMLLSAAGVLP